jgi:hypothetical protein
MTDVIKVRETIVRNVRHVEVVSRGRQGPAGVSPAFLTKVAGAALSGHRIVRLNVSGEAIYASNATAADAGMTVGLTTAAASLGANIVIQTYGEITEPTWNWTADLPIYLGADGALTQTPPASPALFSHIVGFPLAPTKMFIDLQAPIFIT